MSVALSRRLELALPRIAVALLWALALAVAAWICSGWYWRLRASAPLALPAAEQNDPVAAARAVAARHLFGEPARTQAAQPVSSFQLLGVAANSGRSPGFAILKADGKPAQGFIVGEEVAPGARLAAVHADSVEIERSGARETIRLIEASKSSASPAAPLATAPAYPTTVAAQPATTPAGMPSTVSTDSSQPPQPQPQGQAATQPTHDNSLNQ